MGGAGPQAGDAGPVRRKMDAQQSVEILRARADLGQTTHAGKMLNHLLITKPAIWCKRLRTPEHVWLIGESDVVLMIKVRFKPSGAG
ncbi:MAG: hypothetical protein ACK52U_07755 [Synechococcaceae cyanobacterium]|jgi:hypothetical protein